MSGFKRTISGLNNQHLFFDVDLIVFLEGGSISYNKEQVYADHYSNDTEDIIFWTHVFERFKNDKKIKFKSIGSKSTIKEIVADIINGQLKTVLVAMDNEFDEILHSRIDHPSVYYTNGYSWENDIWCDGVIKAVIEELTAVSIEHSDIENNYQDFLNKIKVAVYADAYLFKMNSSFFNRKKGILFCVECNSKDLPEIKTDVIESKITEKGITRRKAMRYGNKHSIDVKKYCYGHFLSDYCCQVISHYLKNRHALTNLSKAIICRMGIKKHFDLKFSISENYTYYQTQFEKNRA